MRLESDRRRIAGIGVRWQIVACSSGLKHLVHWQVSRSFPGFSRNSRCWLQSGYTSWFESYPAPRDM